jgi:hypothetical protein
MTDTDKIYVNADEAAELLRQFNLPTDYDYLRTAQAYIKRLIARRLPAEKDTSKLKFGFPDFADRFAAHGFNDCREEVMNGRLHADLERVPPMPKAGT